MPHPPGGARDAGPPDRRHLYLDLDGLEARSLVQQADRLEVFVYLSSRFAQHKAAQMTERVFRGGVLSGGAPFTKDAVYQRGYCRVFNFLRAAYDHGDYALVQAFLA
ncbi:MAG: DUF1704 domain-containing protein, partial [Acidobacteria bacterium]|nr:DUF1704 domain-containing protein [Acidobacteriota bacterium]